MDFRLTPAEREFQDEVRAFLAGHPPFPRPTSPREAAALSRKFDRLLAEREWLTMAWPREYGGRDATIFEQLILIEEVAFEGIPWSQDQGIGHVGPVLMLYGTDEQKQRFLPAIAHGEIQWAQAFSERNAGSDLAALELRADRDGDFYVMNGHKIWIGGAQFANWVHFMARTGEGATKHRGISYFLSPTSAHGITISEIPDMKGEPVFCEIQFDDVRVPVSQRVGDENQGWYVATAGLNYQRSNIQSVAQARRFYQEVVREGREAIARSYRLTGRSTDLAIELEVARLLSYRVAWMQSQGFLPLHEASIDKIFITELQQRLAAFGIAVLGPAAQLLQGDLRAPIEGDVPREVVETTVGTIGLGSSEIQRTVIANKGLGLPR